MITPQEKRRHRRTEFNWPVGIQTAETVISGTTKDISSGGAFINCKTKLAPGEIFHMVIYVQSQPIPLMGDTEVVWTSRHGMGVKFHPECDAKNKRSQKIE